MERGAWRSNTGFLLAAIGSAVGLGNIWRFSYLAYKNGGGSFLIPYAIALFSVGIPILILEFAIGHKMRAAAPKAFERVNKEWEWLGWWPVIFVMFGIALYYVVVIAWFGLYMGFSAGAIFGQPFPWEGRPEAYFFNDFLNRTDGPFQMGAFQPAILGATTFFWFALWFICLRQVDKGVERACRVFMPLLVILTTTLVIWGLTLEGAGEGVKQYLTPDWSKLGEVQVWRDAFGQIFFSLSIGFGIMIAYSSYLPEKTDLVRNAFITACVNCFYSVFAGLAVFSALGYMAHTKGVGIDEVADAGPGLCFVVYPEIISLLPWGAGLFGFLFFLTLVLAGVTSAISIVEAFTSAVIDKFGWKRSSVVTTTCLLGFLGSSLFTTGAGLYWLDIVDHFLNNYGLIVVGLLECLVIVWYYRIDKLHFHLSDASEGGYSRSWDMAWEWCVKFVAPTVLIAILAWSLIEDFQTPYEGYPTQALLTLGVGWVLGTFLVSGIFSTFNKERVREIE
jgi:neurotransmitter:Na+ symporter, NSS family